VHLSFRDGGAEVYGVSSHHVVKELYGRGRVFGVAFQPGAFRPFLGRSVSSITDRSVLAADIFGWLPENADVAAVEGVLRANLPEPDRNAEFAQLAVERIIDDPAVTRVDALASGLGTSVRSLQRLFAKHVGVGPKWVIRRYRLHEVTERMPRAHRSRGPRSRPTSATRTKRTSSATSGRWSASPPPSIGSGTEAMRRTAAVRHPDLLAPGQVPSPGSYGEELSIPHGSRPARPPAPFPSRS